MRPNRIPQNGKFVEGSRIEVLRRDLLDWYDGNRRVLPWRAAPGDSADPYHVWLSEVMLQQTVVAAVIPYFLKFIEKWPTVHALAHAPEHEVMDAWAGLGYYARARNLHACAKMVSSAHGGAFPCSIGALKGLPGIGNYTSAAIASIAFGLPALGVDGNVERVLARVFAIEEKKAIQEMAIQVSEGRMDRPGDFAQALMDLGATVCTPRAPRCSICPVSLQCKARTEGAVDRYPVRPVKKARPGRFGYVHWIADGQGRVLLERREKKGLLGGMTGFPTSDWIDGRLPKKVLPDSLKIKDINKIKLRAPLEVYHVFTHFNLSLTGMLWEAKEENLTISDAYFWEECVSLKSSRLPGLFKKFYLQVMDFKGNIIV